MNKQLAEDFINRLDKEISTRSIYLHGLFKTETSRIVLQKFAEQIIDYINPEGVFRYSKEDIINYCEDIINICEKG